MNSYGCTAGRSLELKDARKEWKQGTLFYTFETLNKEVTEKLQGSEGIFRSLKEKIFIMLSYLDKTVMIGELADYIQTALKEF